MKNAELTCFFEKNFLIHFSDIVLSKFIGWGVLNLDNRKLLLEIIQSIKFLFGGETWRDSEILFTQEVSENTKH